MKPSALVQFLLDHNKKQSELFCSADVALSRRKYRAVHPTEIAALKCMDGRLNLAVMTETPTGIIQPFRNIGGKFDMGWPYFGHLLDEWVRYAGSRGRDCLILVTYHLSKGDTHRGCKGFGYDTEGAKAYTLKLKEQIERVFGALHSIVYPINVGIETDEDSLRLHGANGDILDLAAGTHYIEDDLRTRLVQMYPDMKRQIVEDLLPLLLGNLRHITEIRRSNRPIAEAEHREQILAVGRGFDWLHLPNKALIVGPYSPNMGDPIATAAGLLKENIEHGRIPKDEGIVLFSAAVYREEAGSERPRAIEKAQTLARFSLETIRNRVPEIEPLFTPLVGVVNLNTRFFTPIPLCEEGL